MNMETTTCVVLCFAIIGWTVVKVIESYVRK